MGSSADSAPDASAASPGAGRRTPWAHPFADVGEDDGRRVTVLHGGLGGATADLKQCAAANRILETLGEPRILQATEVDRDGTRLRLRCGATGELRSLGRSLGRPARLSWVVHVLLETCGALDAAHGLGVFHGALTPASVLVGPEPERPTVKVTDFGLAHIFNADRWGSGPPPWQPHAPEHMMGQPSGPTTDVYLVGALAFAMLAGRPAFEGDEVGTVMRRHAIEEPPKLHRMPLPQRVPRALSRIVLRCLVKEGEDRFDGPADLAEALRAHMSRAWQETGPSEASGPIGRRPPSAKDLIETPKVAALRPKSTPAARTTLAQLQSRFTPTKAAPAADASANAPDVAAPPTDLSAREPDATAAPPELAAPASDPAAPSPELAAPASDPAAPSPELAAPAPELAAPPSDPAAPAPELAAPASDPAAPAPEVATPGSEVTAPPLDIATPGANVSAPASDVVGIGMTAAHSPAVALPREIATADPPQVSPGTAAAGPGDATASAQRRRPWLLPAAVAVVVGAAVAAAFVLRGDPDPPSLPSVAVAAEPDTPAPAPEADPARAAAEPAKPEPDDLDASPADPEDPEASPEPEEAVAEGVVPGATTSSKADQARALVREAAGARRRGDTAKAIRLYKRALAVRPGHAQAASALSFIHFNSGEYAAAVRYGKLAVRASPRNKSYRLKLGDTYYKMNRRADAKAQWERAASLGSTSARKRLTKL